MKRFLILLALAVSALGHGNLLLALQQPSIPNGPATLWVDPSQGHDPSDAFSGPNMWGVRGRFNRPFATIAAATRVSLAGDTIRVASGNYSTDTIKLSVAALRTYTPDGPFIHLSDSGETWLFGSFATLAQQTSTVLAYIDTTQLGSLWTNSGFTTQAVKAGDVVLVGTPQKLNGLTVDPTGNWGKASSGTGMPLAAGGVAGTLALSSTGVGTDFNKAFTPPANGHLTLIVAMMSTGALASGNGHLAGTEQTGAQLFFQWSTQTHVNVIGGSGAAGFGFDCVPSTWNVYSASLGGASGLVGYLNSTSMGTSAQSPTSSGAASSLDLNGNVDIGHNGQTGNNFAFAALLNTDSETGNNANLRNAWEGAAKCAEGTF